jgi:hypothetical protein
MTEPVIVPVIFVIEADLWRAELLALRVDATENDGPSGGAL